jgi:hypothetical protein
MTWNWEACQCFAEVQCAMLCVPNFSLDPRVFCSCVSDSIVEALYDHGLNAQCEACTGSGCGSGGSGSIDIDIDIDHDITIGGGSSSGHVCGPGYYWDMEACACLVVDVCNAHCAVGFQLDPREECACVTLSIYDAIYNHGLDANCQLTCTSNGCGGNGGSHTGIDVNVDVDINTDITIGGGNSGGGSWQIGECPDGQ